MTGRPDNLKARVAAVLLQADPMGIYFKDFDNRDEYDPEAEELAGLLPSCQSRSACCEALQGVFRRYFGDLIVSREIDWDALTGELWELRPDHDEF